MLGGPLERSGFPPPAGGFTPSRCGLFLLRRSQSIYKRAKNKANYNAKVFLGMVVDKGGVETARYLLDTPPYLSAIPTSGDATTSN